MLTRREKMVARYVAAMIISAGDRRCVSHSVRDEFIAAERQELWAIARGVRKALRKQRISA
jgi:hypothetical protein